MSTSPHQRVKDLFDLPESVHKIGFVEELACSGAAFVAHAARLMRAAPIRARVSASKTGRFNETPRRIFRVQEERDPERTWRR